MQRVRWSIGSTILALVLAAPLVATGQEPERTKPLALQGSSLTWCGDVGPIRAEPERYGDAPVYVGNPPTDRIARWARRLPGYVDIWVDRENLGWVTVTVTQDAAKRQRQLERRFPDVGAVVVEVPNTRKQLSKLQRRVGREVFPEIENASTWLDTAANVVGLSTYVVTDEIVAFLEPRFAGEPLCIEGGDPSMLIPDGPQPTEGDGWTLLGALQGPPEPSYRTGIATTPEQLDALWAEAGMPGAVPPVDFDADVVLWFAEAHGSGCTDLRLDDVVVDLELSLVHPLIVMPDDPSFCTSDLAGAYQFLVALERSRLPAGPFAMQLGAGRAYGDRTEVDVDLSAAGGIASDDDIRIDVDPGPSASRSGAIMEPGFLSRYAFDVRCGIGYLGEINSIHWVTDAAGVPAAWAPLVEDGELEVKVVLNGGSDPHAVARTRGTKVRYEPTGEAPPACDP
jgi:hypothetical protein